MKGKGISAPGSIAQFVPDHNIPFIEALMARLIAAVRELESIAVLSRANYLVSIDEKIIGSSRGISHPCILVAGSIPGQGNLFGPVPEKAIDFHARLLTSQIKGFGTVTVYAHSPGLAGSAIAAGIKGQDSPQPGAMSKGRLRLIPEGKAHIYGSTIIGSTSIVGTDNAAVAAAVMADVPVRRPDAYFIMSHSTGCTRIRGRIPGKGWLGALPAPICRRAKVKSIWSGPVYPVIADRRFLLCVFLTVYCPDLDSMRAVGRVSQGIRPGKGRILSFSLRLSPRLRLIPLGRGIAFTVKAKLYPDYA
jgi:hypothetical protein